MAIIVETINKVSPVLVSSVCDVVENRAWFLRGICKRNQKQLSSILCCFFMQIIPGVVKPRIDLLQRHCEHDLNKSSDAVSQTDSSTAASDTWIVEERISIVVANINLKPKSFFEGSKHRRQKNLKQI